MNTILTDAEIIKIARNVLEQKTEDDKPAAWQLAEGVARAVEAAVLDKLAQRNSRPVVEVIHARVEKMTPDQLAAYESARKRFKLAQQVPLAWQSWSYKNGYGYWGSKQEADRHSALDFEPVALYLHPAPQQADRHALQNQGKHPAPCARFCESKAYEIEIRQLKSQLEQADRQRVPDEWRTALELFVSKKRNTEQANIAAELVSEFERLMILVAAPSRAEQAAERHLRRLLAVRVGMPNTYYDDGEAQGYEHGISIDFMREPVGDIDAKLRALNVSRAAMLAAAPEAPAQASAVDERDRKDAERYRWLRSEHERHDPVCHLSWKKNSDREGNEWVNTANLDAAIDAALAQKGGAA